MTALLALLPIYGFATIYNIFFKKTVSVSIFFSITSIITVLFICGMFDFLEISTYILFYGGVLLLLIMSILYDSKLFEAIKSVPFVIFTVMSIIYLYLMQDGHFFFWDEYSHWGAFIKEMYYFGHFYDSSSVATHLRYPPGISIWDYFIVLPTGYKEGSIYFAYFLILFSSVLMMYEKLQWKQIHWIVLIFMVQMVIFATFGHWFSCIYVDHIIGAIFAGMILSYLVDKYNYKELIYFIFPAIAIVLVKEIGLFFTLSFVGLIVLLSFYNSKLNNNYLDSIKNISKITFLVFVIFISAFLVLKSWNIRQDNLNVAKEHQTINGILQSIVSNKRVLDDKTEDEVKNRFWEVVNHQQLHKEKLSLNYNEFSYGIMKQYKKELKLSTTGTFLFFLIFLIIIYFIQYEKENKHKTLIIGGYALFVAFSYLIILYLSFQVAFGSGALRIPSYVRYMNMSILPLFMVLIYLLLPAFNNKYNQNIFKKNINTKFALLSVFFLVFIFITQPYLKPLYSQLENGFKKNIEQVTPKILDAIPNKSKVLVVFPIRNNGSLNNIIRYCMIPTYSTITKHDFFSKRNESEVLKEYIKYDYIWFVSLTQEVLNKSKKILKPKGNHKVYMLYKLEKKNNEIQVKPIL